MIRIQIRKGKTRSFLKLLIRFLLLAVVSMAVLLTVLALISNSGKDIYSIVDPMVKWIPREFHPENFSFAYEVMGGTATLFNSLLLYILTAAAQVVSSAVIAYGFSRYNFKGRKICFGLMIATFFVPQQILMLPRYVLFAKYGMLSTAWSVILPAALGQGIKQTILILIFWMFMSTVPISLEEAAMIDGASLPGIFFRIGVPLAAPGFIISSVLSFAWNWNDTYFSTTYFKGKIRTMTIALDTMKEYYKSQGGLGGSYGNDQLFHAGVDAAAALIVILPLLILYLLLEKKLIESVDRAGITGE